MNVLVVNWLDRKNPQAGGAEVHLHEIFGRLAARGLDVTVLASGWPGCPTTEAVDGMEVHRAGGRHSFLFQARRYYRKCLSSRRFDLVLEDLNKVPVFSPLWSGRPVAILVHHLFGTAAFQEASVPFAVATWILERPIPWVYRGCPAVAVSDSTASDLEARGLNRDDLTVIPNGVDVERYAPDPEGRETPEPTILYLGRLKRYKRVDLILRAVARLRREGVPCRAVIAGTGDHGPELEALAADLGVSEAVDFPGFVPEERKIELFRSSWVHCLTSPKEGWGIANLEAAACGTPTVASDSPGLRESVVEGETGFLVPHGDVAALAGRIRRLIEDRALRRRMAGAARSFAEGFSWDGAADRMREFLEGAVRPRGAPG